VPAAAALPNPASGGIMTLAQQQILAYQQQMAAQQALFARTANTGNTRQGATVAAKSARPARIYV
jgi:hypothetical protein